MFADDTFVGKRNLAQRAVLTPATSWLVFVSKHTSKTEIDSVEKIMLA